MTEIRKENRNSVYRFSNEGGFEGIERSLTAHLLVNCDRYLSPSQDTQLAHDLGDLCRRGASKPQNESLPRRFAETRLQAKTILLQPECRDVPRG